MNNAIDSGLVQEHVWDIADLHPSHVVPLFFVVVGDHVLDAVRVWKIEAGKISLIDLKIDLPLFIVLVKTSKLRIAQVRIFHIVEFLLPIVFEKVEELSFSHIVDVIKVENLSNGSFFLLISLFCPEHRELHVSFMSQVEDYIAEYLCHIFGVRDEYRTVKVWPGIAEFAHTLGQLSCMSV